MKPIFRFYKYSRLRVIGLIWDFRFLIIKLLGKNRVNNHDGDSIVVSHQYLEAVNILSRQAQDAGALEIPEVIIIKPGKYRFCGSIYECILPGIYRFSYPQKLNRQHIVISPNNSIETAIFASLLSVRGNKDNFYPIEYLLNTSWKRFLSVTCTTNSMVCQSILEASGFRSRLVYSHTMENLNSFNNAHSLIEVWSDSHQKYVLVDVDRKCLFTDQDGLLLSLFEFSKANYNEEKTSIESYSAVTMVDLAGFIESSTKYDYAFIEYLINSSPVILDKYISRICEIPYFKINDTFIACAWDSIIEKRVIQMFPKWKCMNADEFHDVFYSGDLSGSI
jgi:hypothetical protein